MRKIIPFFALFLYSISVSSQCADAGSDTTVCGLNFGLRGTPDNGQWSYLCADSIAFLELTGTTMQGIAGVTVAACGTYSFVYEVNDMGCVDSDTITVKFEDPSTQTRTFSYDIGIDYGSHDCPILEPDTCSNVRVINGTFPPRPFWTIDVFGICDVTFPLSVVSNPDSSNCTAIVNHLGTNRMDTLERLWTSSQDAFVTTDPQKGEILENRFLPFVDILEGSLSGRLDSACYPFSKCFIEDAPCVDVVLDSTVVLMPVHVGGRWNIINQSGNLPLNDTTDFIQSGKGYRLIIQPGARYFGPNNIRMSAFRRDTMTGAILDLDTTTSFVFFWQEEWVIDTLYRVTERLVPNGNCPDCGGNTLVRDTMVFPAPPTTFCPTLDISFNPPIPFEIEGDSTLCEGRFVVLGAPEGKEEYRWNNGTTSRFNFIMTPGLVTLETVDSTGCVTRDSVNVIDVPRPDYRITGDTTMVCQGDCLDLDIDGDSIRSYQWSNLDLDEATSYCIDMDTLIWVEVEDLAGCFYRDSFTIDIDPLFAIDAGVNKVITCIDDTVVLIPDTLRLDTVGFFQWEGPGIDVSNENNRTPTVTEPGLYFLRVGAQMNNCLGFDTVRVVLIDNRPDAIAGSDQLINCQDSIVTLDGASSEMGPNFSLEWSGPGIDDNNKNETNPRVSVPGVYILSNCNNNTGCCDLDTINVGLNRNQPRADAGNTQTISCDSAFAMLGGPNTSTGLDFSYRWTGPGITPMNENELNPVVSIPGMYFLEVTDTVSKCISVDGVEVMTIGVIPVADAGPDQSLTCSEPSVVLDANNSVTAPSIKILWQGPGITGMNQSMLSPSVDVEGTYILTLTDTLGNCVSTDTIMVTNQIRLPIIDAGSIDTIDCDTRGIRLMGSITNDNGRMTVNWTGQGINDQNKNELDPVVDVGGQYILEVTDTVNKCFAVDTVFIIEDFDPAIPDAGPDLELNCDNTTVNLQGKLTNFDPSTTLFQWAGPGIDFQQMFEISPQVDQAGIYILSTNSVNDRCDLSDTMMVTFDTLSPSFTIQGDKVVGCNSDTAMLELVITSGNPRLIGWSTDTGTISGPNNREQITIIDDGVYYAEVIGQNGCRVLDSITITEWNAFELSIETDTVCENEQTGLARALIRGGEFPFGFSLDGGPFSTSTSFPGLGSGNYTLTVRDRDGCQRDFDFTIGETPLIPVENQTFERNFCESENLIIGDNFGLVNPTFRWIDNPAANIKRSVQDTGVYILQLFNECDTAEIEYIVTSDLLPEDKDGVFKMPNAFTPNDDDLNDEFGPVWQIMNLEEFTFIDYTFDVVNRWGEIIYTTDDPTMPWDGILDGNPAPAQGYFYRISVQLEDCKGTRLQFKSEGTVALLR